MTEGEFIRAGVSMVYPMNHEAHFIKSFHDQHKKGNSDSNQEDSGPRLFATFNINQN